MSEKIEKRKQAVALRYKPELDEVPIVVAKGKGIVAEKIMEVAEQHGVKVREDASLVEVLSTIDLNQHIPPELYKLVAEILSFMYRTDQQAKQELFDRADKLYE